MSKIQSVNLTDRNQKVYDKFFRIQGGGRNGQFSKWVNNMMNKEFTLSPIEALKQRIKANGKEIEELDNINKTLIEKLNILMTKESLLPRE